MPSPDRYPLRRPVPWRAVDTEALVVDVKEGLLYPLNPPGARIWALCDGARSVEDIVRVLVAEFEGDAATIGEQTRTFVDALGAAGLVSLETRPRG